MTKDADGKDKSSAEPDRYSGVALDRRSPRRPANMDNPDKVRAMVLWGHAPNSQTRMKEMKTAMEQLDMLVVVDPYPNRICRAA